MTRNAADVVEATVRHHLGLGVERMLIVDNGSTDGTFDVLRRLARELPIALETDDGPFEQGQVFTRLAREAAQLGADWVLPLDADEFWVTSGAPLATVLGRTRAGALRVEVVNFIQDRRQREPDRDGLLTMTMRVPETLPQGDRTRELLREHRVSFLELSYPPKHVLRTGSELAIPTGNHRARGVNGRIKPSDRLLCLHAPLRSMRDLEHKAEHGRRVEARGYATDESWHVRRWAEMARRRTLQDDWPSHSYEDGCLDVRGRRVPLVEDTRLRDAVAPLLSDSG